MWGKVSIYSIILAASLFVGFMVIISWEAKIPSVKDARFTNFAKNLLMTLFLLCLPVILVSAFIEWATQPSGMARCMQGITSESGDEAIAWMEDYCKSIQAG